MSETTATAQALDLTVTDEAMAKLLEALSAQGRTDLALRVYVKSGGCSGVSYGMGLDEVRDDDLQMMKGDLKVVVDPYSAQHLNGAVVGFKTEEQGAGFTIENPHAEAKSGCGGCSCG